MTKVTRALQENAWTLLKLTWFLIFMYAVLVFLLVELGFVFDPIVSTSCETLHYEFVVPRPVPTPIK